MNTGSCLIKGLGTCNMHERPIVYASRSITTSEKNCAQIEKELMGIVFGCERLSDYVIDNNITVETDHISLVNIINKSLTQAICCILLYSLTVRGLSNMLYICLRHLVVRAK